MSNLVKNIFDIKRSGSYIAYNKYHTGNIFGITKVSRWEIMHSNFISWALDPHSSHALYFYPLYQLVRSLKFIKGKPDNEKARFDADLIYKFYDEDFITGATVQREVAHIDILLQINTKDKILPILIENKVDSNENGKGGSQTKVYFAWGEKEFADRSIYYEPVYIFLFPEYHEKIIQKEESYIRMTYQELIDYVIEPSMLMCGDESAVNNFKVYLQCLSFQSDNEKGEYSMCISNEERKILDDFIKENKNLLCAVLNELKDDVDDPQVLSSITSTVRDYSTYKFLGQEYRKNQLVLAVVKKYCEDYDPADFATLQAAFPDSLQGSRGVVRLLKDISDKDKGIGGQKRYYVDDADVIKTPSGEKSAVCTQWVAPTIEKFIKHAKDNFNYDITKA